MQENGDHQGIQIYNSTSTDEIQNTTTNGNEVRYLKTNNLKNKMTSGILINSKMYVNMQADQAALQENSENTNQIIFCFSKDYDVSSNKTPSIKKEYFELI